jgi:hypothetical protein
MDTTFVLMVPLLTMLLIVPLIVVLNVVLVRLTWRTATQNMPGSEPSLPPGKAHGAGKEPQFRPQQSGGVSVAVILLIVAAAGIIPLVLCGGLVGAYWMTSMTSRDSPATIQETIQRTEAGSHEHLEQGPPPVPTETVRPE